MIGFNEEDCKENIFRTGETENFMMKEECYRSHGVYYALILSDMNVN